MGLFRVGGADRGLATAIWINLPKQYSSWKYSSGSCSPYLRRHHRPSERELGSDAVARLSAGALASTLDGVLCMCGVCRAHQIAALCFVLKDFKLCGTMWLRSFAFDPCRVFLCCSAFSATCLRLFLAVCCCFLLFAAVCLLELCGVA